MFQLENSSPLPAEMFGFPDRQGVDTMYLVVKATFSLHDDTVVLADQQQPVTLADEYSGEPGASSLRYPSEAHIERPGTDVLVLGDACAPDETPAPHVDLSVVVAGRRKDARVYGDRHFTERIGGLGPSKAEPFVRLPVVYERTYGGVHEHPKDGTILSEPRNPVGCGFAGKRSVSELLGTPVPNIEDPTQPMRAPTSKGRPIGFGPIAPSWAPRAGFAGTYDERWEQTRAPYLPTDFDPRFLNVAAEGLTFADGLVGGEPVAILGFHPRGLQRFKLPQCELSLTARVDRRETPLPYALERVVLEPTNERLTMTWRAALTVNRDFLRVEALRVELGSLHGGASQGAA